MLYAILFFIFLIIVDIIIYYGIYKRGNKEEMEAAIKWHRDYFQSY